MPANLTVTPIYDSVNKLWFNQLKWSFPSPLPQGAEVIVSRSLNQATDLDTTEFPLFELVRLKKSATSYLDRKVEQDYTYYYNVRGSNEEEEEFPVLVSGVIPSFDEPAIIYEKPKAPINFRINDYNKNSISFSWNFTEKNENPIFIDYSTNGLTFLPLISNIAPNVVEYELKNYYLNKPTTFKIYTKNLNGEKSTDVFSDSIQFNFSYETRPVAPTNLNFETNTATTGKLTWTNNNPNAENLEHLIWLTTPSGPVILYDSVLATDEANSSSIILTNLASGTEYCFRCQARAAGGESELSLATTGETEETQIPPATPTFLSILNILSVIQTGSVVNVTRPRGLNITSNVQNIFWNIPILAEEVELYYSFNSNMSSASSVAGPQSVVTTSLTNSNIPSSTTVYYRLVARNAVGETSSVISSGVPSIVPSNPTNLSLNLLTENTFSATWTTNRSPISFDGNVINTVLQFSGNIFGDYGQYNIIVPDRLDLETSTLYPVSSILVNNSTIPFGLSLPFGATFNARIFSVGTGGYSGTPSTWVSATFSTPSQTTTPPAAPKDLRFSQQISPPSQKTIGFDSEGNAIRIYNRPSAIIEFVDGSIDEEGFELLVYPVLYDITTNEPIPFLNEVTGIDLPPVGLMASGSIVSATVEVPVPTDWAQYLTTVFPLPFLRDAYACGVRSKKGVVGTSTYTVSPFSNVSGSSDNILYFEISSFTWGYNQSAVDITNLVSSYYETNRTYSPFEPPQNSGQNYESPIRHTVVTGKILDPFSAIDVDYPEGNYGDWYVIEREVPYPFGTPNPVLTPNLYYLYSILSSTGGIYQPLTVIPVVNDRTYIPFPEIEPSTQFTIDLGPIQNTPIKLRARKVVSLFPSINVFNLLPAINNSYSSGIERTINLGSVPSRPYFQRSPDLSYDPESYDFRLISSDIAQRTITLGWSDYFSTSTLNLYLNVGGNRTSLYSENPASGSGKTFTVTGYDFTQTYTFELVLKNQINEEILRTLRVGTGIAQQGDPDWPVVVQSNYSTFTPVTNLRVTNPRRNTLAVLWDLVTPPQNYGTNEKLIFIVTKQNEIISTINLDLPFPPLNQDIDEFTLTLPQNGGDYLLTVYGENNSGLRSLGTTVSIFMAEPSVQPPQNFRFTSTRRDKIVLAWDYDQFSTGYKIRKTTTTVAGNQTIEYFIVAKVGLFGSFEDTNLISKSTVQYVIQSLTPVTESGNSNTLSFVIPDTPQVIQPPTIVDAPRACVIQGVKAGNVYYQIRRN